MYDYELLDCFMDGFAKRAEEAGIHGEQIRDLLELGIDLAQRDVNQSSFDSGFTSFMERI